MSAGWSETALDSAEDALFALTALKGKNWLCRGQARAGHRLIPTIDRKPLARRPRVEKLALERRSIDVFRSIARYFTDDGERGAMLNDTIALMVLRHHDVTTRLLDWTGSPFVAAYFAAEKHDTEDGAIWAFDQRRYETEGAQQWRRWPETTVGGKGEHFVASLTAFRVDEPPDWFVCAFYEGGFPRQRAQDGAYSMTARFDRDHADAIAQLLGDQSFYHRYVIRAGIKKDLRAALREQHGIWRGALYPDSAGAAGIAREVFPTVPGRKPSRRRSS
jgi:hypothetical protein